VKRAEMDSDEILHVLADESFRSLSAKDGQWIIVFHVDDTRHTFANSDLNALVADMEEFLIELRCRGLKTPRQQAVDLLDLIAQGVPADEALRGINAKGGA
jgi:hypothetical protein